MQALAGVNGGFACGSPFVWQPYLEWLATHDELIQPDQFIVNERANFGEAHFAAGTDMEQLDLSGCNFAGAKLHRSYLTDSTASSTPNRAN